jgi:hypothetical protein
MHERALKALAVYLGLGDKRSLRLLEGHLRGQAAPVGLATLKRWSIKFGWAGEVAKYSREISFEIARDSIEGLEARAFGDLAVVRQAKYRCIEELLRDPNDPSLSAAQRRRLMNPTPLDYCRLLKMEHQLLKCCAARGESVSARRDEAPSRMAEFLAEADLPDLTMKPPNPLSSVVRGAATPSPAPRAGPASPLPFSPIEVAGPDSTITTSARVELPVAPDGLRVEVTVVPTREAPN